MKNTADEILFYDSELMILSSSLYIDILKTNSLFFRNLVKILLLESAQLLSLTRFLYPVHVYID